MTKSDLGSKSLQRLTGFGTKLFLTIYCVSRWYPTIHHHLEQIICVILFKTHPRRFTSRMIHTDHYSLYTFHNPELSGVLTIHSHFEKMTLDINYVMIN